MAKGSITKEVAPTELENSYSRESYRQVVPWDCSFR